MIGGKRFMFGYGDISIGVNPVTRQMCFQQFKPPAEVGDKVIEDKVDWIGERIYIEIGCYEEYQELCRLLDSAKSKKILEFTFKDYIFDFSNYNEKSIEACRKHLSNAMSWYFLAMAC